MAALTCKSTVRFKAFPPAMLRMLRAVYTVARELTEPPEIVITSANDSTHSEHSQHSRDTALDLRVKNIPTEAGRRELAAELRAELGPSFTVLYEAAGTPNAHLHLQVRKGHSYAGPI
jgi:hypothetical protein